MAKGCREVQSTVSESESGLMTMVKRMWNKLLGEKHGVILAFMTLAEEPNEETGKKEFAMKGFIDPGFTKSIPAKLRAQILRFASEWFADRVAELEREIEDTKEEGENPTIQFPGTGSIN